MSSTVQAASSGGRIALAGATGRIGSALAASLVADPVSVVALTRDPQTARLPDTTTKHSTRAKLTVGGAAIHTR